MEARTIKVAPIRKSLTVRADPQKAFDVFTAKMSSWWPSAYSIGASPFKDVVMEPRTNGRWFERSADGAECAWGKVIAWNPPSQVTLAWQINGQWQYDPALVTEIEVRFTPAGKGETRIDFEHRHLERLGEAAEAVRAQLESGWPTLLNALAVAIQA
jgi:uncharacterized protein YndB with AHSA1/START domain